MLMIIIIMGIVAAGLLCVELFIPGFGVCGVLGLILLIASAALIALNVPFGIGLAVLELGAVGGGAAFFACRFFSSKQINSKLILHETLNMDNDGIGDLQHMIGKEGVSRTPLKPIGVVDFNGVSVEAASDGPYIAERQKVKVTAIEKRKIIVKQIN
jgi:membrane-bound serine protease (ClpP class)